MLGKLMKYDMKALGRVFLPFYGALLAISIINRILGALKLVVPMAIGAGVYSLTLGGVCVLTLVLTLQIFRRNLMGNEGYLMFTLPVSTDKLILSKLFTAFVWYILSFIALMISILVISAVRIDPREIISGFISMMNELPVSGPEFALFVLEALLTIAITLLSSIMFLYACISLSLLVSKHRGLFTFGAFVVLSILWQMAVSGIARALPIWHMECNTQSAHTILWGLTALGLVTFFIFYFITRYMLTRRLNLE